MVRITEELIRKKSEHNELLIGTLEELSLHQEDIEKLEHFHNWCRDLKILLLQSNLIPKIENLFKLKKLEYLNLAINNIEKIENLEKLESLNKLDLTLNFIGELTSIECLRDNYNLRTLTLTGNPCTDYPEYRNYVIATLPSLESLDGEDIKPSDRILALKKLTENRKRIVQVETEYRIKRDEQKIRVQQQRDHLQNLMDNEPDEDARKKLFWDMKSENCPEIRCDISNQHRKGKQRDSEPKPKPKPLPKLFAPCGRPYNLNQPKLVFHFIEENDRYELDLHVYKYLDTSLINVDVQPRYIRVTVNGKIFQIALSEEVDISAGTSKRSQVTGQLLVVVPKLVVKENIFSAKFQNQAPKSKRVENSSDINGTVDYKNIVNSNKSPKDIDLDGLPDLI